MLVKKIEYVDFDGETQEEDAYFNLNEAEAVRLDLSFDQGIEGSVLALMEEDTQENRRKMIEMFEKLLGAAYGVKSEDGRRFIKSPTLLEEFKQTAAYSALFTELITDADSAAAFFNGVVSPSRVQPRE